MKTQQPHGEFRVDSKRLLTVETIYFAIQALSDLKGTFTVRSQLSIEGRKSLNNQKVQLDFADVGSIFTESKVPLRNLVHDLKVDSYKRSLFLEHLKSVQSQQAVRKLER